jgi:hypothetical protein
MFIHLDSLTLVSDREVVSAPKMRGSCTKRLYCISLRTPAANLQHLVSIYLPYIAYPIITIMTSYTSLLDVGMDTPEKGSEQCALIDRTQHIHLATNLGFFRGEQQSKPALPVCTMKQNLLKHFRLR